jgi:hypothetical protein
MCSLSLSSCASYRARAFKIATRPHSEHSLRAISSLFSIAEVMENTAGSEVESDGWLEVAEMWMSVSAATVFATT